MKEKQNTQQQKTKKVQPQKAAPVKDKSIFKNETFPLGKQNYIMMAIGFGITVLGYILMVGKEDIMSFRHTTLPVIFVMLGFAVVVYAILMKPKQKKQDDTV